MPRATNPIAVERPRLVVQSFLDHYGLSKRELSLRAGDNPSLVHDLLTRTGPPRRSTLSKLARAMGVTVADLTDPDRPVPDWGASRPVEPEPAEVDPAAPGDGHDAGALWRANGAGSRLLSVPSVYALGDDLLEGGASPLALDPAFTRDVLQARPSSLRLMASPDDCSGEVRFSDYLLVDSAETEANRPGFYVAQHESGRAWVRFTSGGGDRVLGRVVGVLRRL